jgi:hypothetical protein
MFVEDYKRLAHELTIRADTNASVKEHLRFLYSILVRLIGFVLAAEVVRERNEEAINQQLRKLQERTNLPYGET